MNAFHFTISAKQAIYFLTTTFKISDYKQQQNWYNSFYCYINNL